MDLCLYAKHMLTRIAYHTLEIDDKLPNPLSHKAERPRPLKRITTARGKGKATDNRSDHKETIEDSRPTKERDL